MKGLRAFLSLTLGFVLCIVMAGCAAKAPPNPPSALHIAQFTLQTAVIGLPYKQLLVASGGLEPYTWSLTSGSLPPGLSLASDGILSGTPAADPNHPFPYQYNFTIKVTDSQTPTAAYDTSSTNIMVNPVLSFTPMTLQAGTVGAVYSTTITANYGQPPYNYTVTCQNCLPDGITVNANPMSPYDAIISGVPMNAGTFTFTIEASDAASEVATATFTLTISGRLQGPYVMSFNGFNSNQPANSQAFQIAGSFVAGPTDSNGVGQITSGVIDQSGPGAMIATGVAITPGDGMGNGSFYMLTPASNFGVIILAVPNVGLYRFAVVVSSQGSSKLILQDPNNTNLYGSGLLNVQSTTSLSGGAAPYSFGLFGNDAGGNRYGAAGMFNLGNASGGTQPVTGGIEDTNDNGTVGTKVSITGGTLGQVDPNTGRGTLSLSTASGTSNYAYYILSGKELIAIETDPGGLMTLADILAQQLPGASGSFTNASLMGSSVVAIDGIYNNSGTIMSAAAVGAVAFDGMGNIKGPMASDGTQLPGYFTDENDGGNVSQVQYTTGTYNVDQTCGPIQTACGRVTVTLSGSQTPPVWYLSNSNQAFSVSTDGAVMQGTLQPQTTPSNSGFTVEALLGAYLGGTLSPTVASVTNELDVAATPPPGGIWQETYQTSGPGGVQLGQMLTANYDCFGTDPACSDLSTYYGRYELTNPMDNKTLSFFYLEGSGTSGITGTKGGIYGLNVGDIGSGGTTVTDPNPKLSNFTR